MVVNGTNGLKQFLLTSFFFSNALAAGQLLQTAGNCCKRHVTLSPYSGLLLSPF